MALMENQSLAGSPLSVTTRVRPFSTSSAMRSPGLPPPVIIRPEFTGFTEATFRYA